MPILQTEIYLQHRFCHILVFTDAGVLDDKTISKRHMMSMTDLLDGTYKQYVSSKPFGLLFAAAYCFWPMLRNGSCISGEIPSALNYLNYR